MKLKKSERLGVDEAGMAVGQRDGDRQTSVGMIGATEDDV